MGKNRICSTYYLLCCICLIKINSRIHDCGSEIISLFDYLTVDIESMRKEESGISPEDGYYFYKM